VLASGLAWFSQMSADGTFLTDVLGPSLVMGAGAGLAFVSTVVTATSGARGENAGLASGLITTAQQFGASLGLAVVVAIAAARTAQALVRGEPASAVALTEGYRAGMLIAAGFGLLGALLSTVLLRVLNQPDASTPTVGIANYVEDSLS
jgi:hypothetical protein